MSRQTPPSLLRLHLKHLLTQTDGELRCSCTPVHPLDRQEEDEHKLKTKHRIYVLLYVHCRAPSFSFFLDVNNHIKRTKPAMCFVLYVDFIHRVRCTYKPKHSHVSLAFHGLHVHCRAPRRRSTALLLNWAVCFR